jgi:hypothetical protein
LSRVGGGIGGFVEHGGAHRQFWLGAKTVPGAA